MEELLTGLPDKVIAGVEPEYTITLEERDIQKVDCTPQMFTNSF